jgi:hypothetical protein
LFLPRLEGVAKRRLAWAMQPRCVAPFNVRQAV